MSSPTPTKQQLAATKELQALFPVRATAGGASAPAGQSPLATQAYGAPVLSAANSNASVATPAAGTAYPASSYPSSSHASATSAYGQPYPGKGQSAASPAASYGSAYGNSGTPAYGNGAAYPASGSAGYGSAGSGYGNAGAAYPAASSGSAVGKTTAYGMPALNAWQPSTLPVSPWSTMSQGAGGPLGGSVETTTILRADLKALKRSRLKGWGYLFLSLGIFGGLGYLGAKRYWEMTKELKSAKTQLGDAKKGYEAALTKLGVSESAAAAATSGAPGAVIAPPPAATAPVASAATTKLGDDLKKQLAAIPGVTVETRGDRVVIAMDQGALFEGNELEPGMGGYRVLYKLSKILKPVMKDRRMVITVPGDAKKGKTWNVAAARAVSLGRYAIDDVGVDAHRVTSIAPGAPQGRGGRHVEFSLETLTETTKS